MLYQPVSCSRSQPADGSEHVRKEDEPQNAFVDLYDSHDYSFAW